MPKYLLKVDYTLDGIKALRAGGGSARRVLAEEASKSLGGTIEAFYFALGSTDAFVIGEFPDNTAAAALALAVSAGGVATIESVVLLTPEEIDQAARASVDYRPGG